MDSTIISSNIHRDFAQSVEKFQKYRGNPDTLVSAQGLASSFREICLRRATRLLADQSLTDQDRKMLLLEANTWELLQRVYEHRRKPHGNGRTAQEMLKANPYTPTAALYNAWLDHSSRLGELCEVQKWLEVTYKPQEPPLLSKEYWKFTRMDLKQKKRQGLNNRTGYVRTMDPDALNRTGDSGVLNADDAEEERALLNSVFQHIRAGRLEIAAKICEDAARPWRAAVIRGGYFLQWEGLEELMSHAEDVGKQDLWSGNRRWLLWRQTCVRAAMNNALSVTDKAIHAAISPSLVTLPALVPLCHNNWEDQLWARLSALIGDRIETKMNETAGGFWNRGTLLDRLALLEQTETDSKPTNEQDSDWETIIAHQLDELADVAVNTNLPEEDYLRRSQLSVIRQRMKPLIAEVEDSFKHPSDALPVSSIRFFAHLWLFLNMINAPNDLTQSTLIIEKYIEILQNSGNRDIIALYTSFLGHAAIKKYADFLASLPLDTARAELERSLRSAASYHLDVRLVAEEASKLSRDRAAKLFPPETSRLPSLLKTNTEEKLTNGELHMIRSLGWLRYHPSTQDLVLRQSNDDTRWLLCRGRIHAAIQLSADLPDTMISSASGDHGHELEYLLYRKLFALWDQFSILEQMTATEPRVVLDADGRGHWKRRLEDGIENLYESAVGVMTADWGVDSIGQVEGQEVEEGDEQAEQRIAELKKLRKLFIPEIAIRLTRRLIEARSYVPSSISRAMELANLVADGKDKLHLDFVYQGQSRLAEYLMIVREAILEGMEDGGSDPLVPVV
ncbi:hypothetical protein CPB86DRAFT_697475 [Serendipita vermifera]|nr:hypothetical protein CPB86DRAFT_697475 [Serendipita vermifera]